MSITLAATPLGNPDDASPRLRQALEMADLIAAEDTRRVRRLASDLGIALTARLISNHDHNERDRAPELVRAAQSGLQVLVVSDAGMPLVSDPGLAVVRAAVEAQVPVFVVPGPSAVLLALALSGLPADRFCFEGFLPRKPGARRQRLAELATEPRTLVFFEAPHRIPDTLVDLHATFGPARPAAICRELTKTYEQVLRGSLVELMQWTQTEQMRGEFTVVVGGAVPVVAELAPALTQVRALVDCGIPTKVAVTAVAATTGVRKRDLYTAAVSGATSS